MAGKRAKVAAVAAGVVLVGAAIGAWLVLGRDSGALGVAAPPSRESGVLRLGTYNVEGLYDQRDDPKLRGEDDDVPTPEERLTAVAAAIRLIDADVLALQDVESEAAVTWFRDTYLADMGYEHVVSLDVGHGRGAENAVLSRVPLGESAVWPDLRLGVHPPSVEGEPNPLAGKPLHFRRSPLMVEVRMPATDSGRSIPLILFNVELKGGDKHEYWREAEAEALLELASGVGPGRRVILLGSFHAEPGAPSIDSLIGAGYIDVFGGEGESKRWVTETSGDRTDLILANRNAAVTLDTEAGFVLGGPSAELAGQALGDAKHLPLVVGVPADSP